MMEPDASRASLATLYEKTSFEEEFIAQFESLSELWNVQHKDYTNKLKRQEGYIKLLIIYKRYKPHATVDDVRKKINSLRSNYRRDLRRVAATAVNGGVYVPRTKSFKLLSFLYDTETDLDYTEQVKNEQYADVVIKCNPEETAYQFSMSPVSEDPLNTYNHTTPAIATHTQMEASQSTFLSQAQETPQFHFKETATWSLAYVWAQKLEKMDPTQRLFAEKAINDVLFEGEMGSLHRHSIKINECNDLSSKVKQENENR